jgi:hypothetical protein
MQITLFTQLNTEVLSHANMATPLRSMLASGDQLEIVMTADMRHSEAPAMHVSAFRLAGECVTDLLKPAAHGAPTAAGIV